MSLHAQKEPLLFSMVVDGQTVWKETSGITWDGVATWQTVASATDEYYFGGGMQNGRFSHRNTSITISSSGDWSDGGNPNAVPYYVSSAGYSVLRATWAPGTYNFTNPAFAVASHNETRFDGFFFAGDFKQTLDLYTRVTGRPFLPPLYGLGLGDSDCYHNARHGNSTRVVVAVADAYRQHNMPGAWILPNDGYGCGYGEGPESFPLDFSDLDYVVAALHKRGFYTGLWSSTGLRECRLGGGAVAGTWERDRPAFALLFRASLCYAPLAPLVYPLTLNPLPSQPTSRARWVALGPVLPRPMSGGSAAATSTPLTPSRW